MKPDSQSIDEEKDRAPQTCTAVNNRGASTVPSLPRVSSLLCTVTGVSERSPTTREGGVIQYPDWSSEWIERKRCRRVLLL